MNRVFQICDRVAWTVAFLGAATMLAGAGLIRVNGVWLMFWTGFVMFGVGGFAAAVLTIPQIWDYPRKPKDGEVAEAPLPSEMVEPPDV